MHNMSMVMGMWSICTIMYLDRELVMCVSAIHVYCIINTIAEMQVAAVDSCTYILQPTSSFYLGGGATHHVHIYTENIVYS